VGAWQKEGNILPQKLAVNDSSEIQKLLSDHFEQLPYIKDVHNMITETFIFKNLIKQLNCFIRNTVLYFRCMPITEFTML